VKVTYCDICELPIKKIEKKWVIGLKEVEEVKEDELDKAVDILERYRKIQRDADKLEVYEICQTCKKVLESFLALRRSQVLKIKNEIDKLIV